MRYYTSFVLHIHITVVVYIREKRNTCSGWSELTIYIYEETQLKHVKIVVPHLEKQTQHWVSQFALPLN